MPALSTPASETATVQHDCPRCGRDQFRVSQVNPDDLTCQFCHWEIPAEVAGVAGEQLVCW